MEMYSPVKGRIINDEEVLQQGVRTYRMAREDLEPMLQRQFGRKLEPVKGNKYKTPPRKGEVVQFCKT